MTKRYSSRKRRDNNSPLAVIGAGLILVGAALFLILANSQNGPSSQPAADEFSVVPAAVNYTAPGLSLTSVSGNTESLADYHQKVLLVNNWAIWCPPCKAEMPTLESFYESHQAEDFVIIAIEAGDSLNAVSQFAQNYGLKFHIWLDPQNASLSVFRNPNLPNSYVIDRTGTVRYAWTGAISRAMLEKYVTPLLTQNN